MASSSPPAPDPGLPAMLLVLTAVTGVVDAVSFLALGHVFTANMTGNIAFLGFATAGVPGVSAARSIVALAAFFAGALAGGRMAAVMSGAEKRKSWIGRAFLFEAVLLAAAGACGFGTAAAIEGQVIALYAIIVLTAAAMGLRSATVRKLGISDLTTTVLTLTIAGLAADSSLAGGGNPAWMRRVGSIVAMLLGAAAGAWLLSYSLALPLFAAAIAAMGCAIAVRAS
jgi:uncharacterized membrane protein YoaK (UPF0700 family)